MGDVSLHAVNIVDRFYSLRSMFKKLLFFSRLLFVRVIFELETNMIKRLCLINFR